MIYTDYNEEGQMYMGSIPPYEPPIPPGLKKSEEFHQRIAKILTRFSMGASPMYQGAQALVNQMAQSYFGEYTSIAAPMYPGVEAFASSMAQVYSRMPPITPIVESPLLDWVSKVGAFAPTFPDEYWNELTARLQIDPARYIEHYKYALYMAKWFPMTGWQAGGSLAIEINAVLATTRPSKNRIRKLDRVILSHFTKTRIESMKNEWRDMGMPKHLMKILRQAVRAYHRKEYALTTIVLATVWEGIIYAKTDDSGFKRGKKTKDHFAELIKENDMDNVFQSFFEEFIVYNCKSPQDAIPDVPGRHSLAHCMYDSYPTRKAALNAILFTDFLLMLNPVCPTGESKIGYGTMNTTKIH